MLSLLSGSSPKPGEFPQVSLQIFPCASCSRDGSEPLCGTHLAQHPFPRGTPCALMADSEAQRCPLSPQLSPARVLWEHKALPGRQNGLDAAQRIPFISNLPFAVSPAHTDLGARGAAEGPVWFLITASVAINRDGCLGLSHLIAMFVLEDMIQLLQAALHLTSSMGSGK